MRSLSRGFASTVAIIALVLFLAAPWSASACTCARFSEPCVSFQMFDGVFVGKVTSLSIVTTGEPRWTHRVVRFAVVEGFSGVSGNTIEIRTGLGGGDCGFPFVTGRSYFVYASRSKDGVLQTNICSGTKGLAAAQTDLAYARQVAHGDERVGLYGRVERLVRPSLDEYLKATDLGGVSVTIEGPAQQRFTAVTDAKGRFSVAGHLEGNYTVRAATPEGLPEIAPQQVTVEAGKCSGVILKSDGLASLAGRVTGLSGRPLSAVQVKLVSEHDTEILDSEEVRTSKDGRYLIEHIPPGSYVLAVNPKGTADELEAPYPRTFFPRAGSAKDAERIVLRAEETRELPDFEIAPPAAARTITGVVRWPDGRPAAGIEISLNVDHCGRIEQTDAEGRFKLTGYEGYSYTLTAVTITKDAAVQAEPEELTVGGEDLRFELVLDQPAERPMESDAIQVD